MAKYLDQSGLSYFWGKLKNRFQDKLVSGTNIKTINNTSLLGSGNIDISGGGGSISAMKRIGASSGTLTLSTSYQTIKMSQTSFTEGSDFEASTNGIKCKKAGLIHISAKVRLADGFTANDYVNCRVYNNTTSTAIGSGRIRVPFQAYNGDVVIDCYAVVSANDDIYLQAQNETGSRGKVTYSVTVLSIAYVNTGSGGGGGASDFSELSFDPNDYNYSVMPADWLDPLLENVTDSVSFVDWLFETLGDISSRLP